MSHPVVHLPALKADHLTLMVRSLEASASWYATLLPALGFSRTKTGNWGTPDGFFLQVLQADADTADYARRAPGLNHVGFGAPDEETVLRIQAAMRAAGFEAPEIQNLGGARALFMRDPDGIRFEVTYYPPGVSVVD